MVAEVDPHEEDLHSEDDDLVDLAEDQAGDRHDEAVVDGLPASTSTSLDLSTRQS